MALGISLFGQLGFKKTFERVDIHWFKLTKSLHPDRGVI